MKELINCLPNDVSLNKRYLYLYLGLRKQVDTLFDAIKHGDEEHQTWLKEKIEEHFKDVI